MYSEWVFPSIEAQIKLNRNPEFWFCLNEVTATFKEHEYECRTLICNLIKTDSCLNRKDVFTQNIVPISFENDVTWCNLSNNDNMYSECCHSILLEIISPFKEELCIYSQSFWNDVTFKKRRDAVWIPVLHILTSTTHANLQDFLKQGKCYPWKISQNNNHNCIKNKETFAPQHSNGRRVWLFKFYQTVQSNKQPLK